MRTGETSERIVSVPLVDPADEALLSLTPEWYFDPAQVGDQCVPPDGATAQEPVNTTIPNPTDLLGGEVGAKPELPQPGDQPADPASETAEALLSIRTVYDIYDLYNPEKHALTDDPPLAAVIFKETQQLQVVEPFIGQLDPIFDSLVFTAPSEASVLYQVGPSYQWEIGRVILIDGTWRVALGTLCRDLNDAGYQCPGVESDPRPGPLG